MRNQAVKNQEDRGGAEGYEGSPWLKGRTALAVSLFVWWGEVWAVVMGSFQAIFHWSVYGGAHLESLVGVGLNKGE